MNRMTPQLFVQRWQNVALTERAASQSHFIDLCALLNVPTPVEEDPKGTFYTFEKGVAKAGGGQGFADVWKRNAFAWEYKKKKRNLNEAYNQLLQYREALENPPLLVVCDMDRIEIHTNFTNTVKQITPLSLDDLLDPQKLDQLRRVWLDPESFRAPQTTVQATEEAAKKFAGLADILRKWGHPPDAAAHYLIRLLFCLFAEDIGLLPNKVFSKLIRATRGKSDAFTAQLALLFDAMRGGGFFGSEEIPHFNGGLFDNNAVLRLPVEGIEKLLEVAELDWASIEPAIFGTLFERSLDPGKRAQLGAHYTSRDDILLIVEPVLMAPLRREWAELRADAEANVATGKEKEAKVALKNLRAFADKLATVRVLDPAAGSGNFLYVALKQMLDLEKEVITTAQTLTGQGFFPQVSPEQLHGMELNEYAHELAQATVWIGYIQWLRDNGYGRPSEPILKAFDNIRQMDAILAFDDAGNATEPEWVAADVIIGNPPFLGDKKMRRELGNDYVDALRNLYEGRVPGGADLVTYWFERARELVEQEQVQRVGLLSTNSIRGGKSREVLDRIKENNEIFMAWSDNAWVLDGAAVRVSIIGFDDGSEGDKYLDGIKVKSITSALTGDVDLSQASILEENRNLSFIGTQKTGAFDITAEAAQKMLSAKGNPNGKSNSDIVKPWINGLDITRRPRNMWIVDFGVDTSLEVAAEYEVPFEYIVKVIKPTREVASEKNTGVKWWLFARSRPEMRMALAKLPEQYIATARVAKYRLFVYIPKATIPDSQVVVIARDDDYFFGVLHSRVHELWALRMGTSLEDRPRYTPTTTFETFPFPFRPSTEDQNDPRILAIAAAAQALVQKRYNWLNPTGADDAELKKRTLTNLYNQRPQWLINAHKALDSAVLAAYNWPADIHDEELLSNLLELNLQRSGK